MNSVNNETGDRCVDFFVGPDGRYGYREFRRDPEDQGAWSIMPFDPSGLHARYEDALAVALTRVVWLDAAVQRAAPFAP